MNKSELMPVLYLPHGGGPLPLLGEAGHQDLITFLTNIPKVLPKPKAQLKHNDAALMNGMLSLNKASHV